MIRTKTSSVAVCTLFVSTIANAQATYTIAYQFDDEPEVVRVEPEAFSVNVRRAPLPEGLFLQTLLIDQRAQTCRQGLNMMTSTTRTRTGDSAARSTILRSMITFDDLVFRSAESMEILVGLSLFSRGLVMVVSSGKEFAGIEYRDTLIIEIDGQRFIGESIVTLTGDEDRFSVRREGIFTERDRAMVPIRDILVPTNEPVEFSIEIIRSMHRPQGVTGDIMQLVPECDTAFPWDRGVFDLPEGVRVDSVQAEIFNNRWRGCRADMNSDGRLDILDFLEFQHFFAAGDLLADFDGDGVLTLFDFLAFQNAFVAGCP